MGATGLDALVGAATEGMRKTKSAEEMSEEEKEPVAAVAENGHLSDSAVAPTRERKKGASRKRTEATADKTNRRLGDAARAPGAHRERSARATS
jgi:hypothetical protein